MKKLLSILFALSAIVFVACNDDDDNNSSVNMNDAVKSFIETKYPGATIVGTEKSANGLVEVEIVHDNVKKDVYFNKDNVWVYTDWDVSLVDFSQELSDKILALYPDYHIDDVDYVQSPDGDYYKVDIEKGNFEKYLKLSLDGSSVVEL